MALAGAGRRLRHVGIIAVYVAKVRELNEEQKGRWQLRGFRFVAIPAMNGPLPL